MTELEKIAYAKTFIDKLANGVNPLDDTPIPEGDTVNQLRISRCLFFVSEVLRQAIEKGHESERIAMWESNARQKKGAAVPFSVTQDTLRGYELRPDVSPTEMTRRLNALIYEDIAAGRTRRLQYQKITRWLRSLCLLEWRELPDGKVRLFPTDEGEAMGITGEIRKYYGRYSAVLHFNEEAQRFILDHLDAIVAYKSAPAALPENEDPPEE